MKHDIIEIRRLASDPAAVARELGLDDGAKRQPNGLHVRCPWHVERTPSCSITRGPDGTIRVACFGCGATGDVLDLVAAVRGLDMKRDFRRVLEETLALVGRRLDDVSAPAAPRLPIVPPPPVRVPLDELEAFWAQTLPVNRTLVCADIVDMAAQFYLARRRWYPPALAALDLVRITPLPATGTWPSWWPRWWASDYRLVVRAYTAAGDFASVHARSVTPGADPKAMWPKGYQASGLLLADRRAVAYLRGDVADTDRVLIVEGVPDLVAMSLEVADYGLRHAVIGVTAGAAKALRDVRWHKEIPLMVVTHEDTAGEGYAKEIAAALPPGLDAWRARVAVAAP